MPTYNIIDNPSTHKLLKYTKVIVWFQFTIMNKKGSKP